MMVAMMTVCNPGDKVGVFSPFYENYAADAILCGALPVHVPLHPPHYRFDPAELRRAFAGGLKAFVLCNPSNPTGQGFLAEELVPIAALAEEFDAFVITDEVYEHIVYPPHRHTYFAALPGMAARTLMCSSLSKTFAITGWRLGYVHAAPELIAQARKVHDFLTVGRRRPAAARGRGRTAAPGPTTTDWPGNTPSGGTSSSGTWTGPAWPTPGPKAPTM